MRSFILLTLLSALACVPSQAQFSFPGSQSALGNNLMVVLVLINPGAYSVSHLGGGGGGGLFSNLIGALTGRNRNPIGGGGGGGGFGAYPYPVPVPYPGYSPYGPPSPYGPGFGYPGFGGSYYG
ncbi:unnamed protein product [Ceratitis capitata]|uniref:(Mediterranean fruit fly) hypothetical protein n=1 Tax=Ceratitis capitata TaxID=7213 RepID=A0A811UAP6_CERCA|nr:unnamed protein product [Ceratitis capitata]